MNPHIDWNTRSEKQKIAGVGANAYRIQHIDDPSEAVQLAAVNQAGYAIKFIVNPTQVVLLTSLKDQRFINNQCAYEKFVKEYFANNTLLLKKWIKCGEFNRSNRSN